MDFKNIEGLENISVEQMQRRQHYKDLDRMKKIMKRYVEKLGGAEGSDSARSSALSEGLLHQVEGYDDQMYKKVN